MDLIDSIDKILPVVFFIIWIFFGIFAKSKKLQKAPGGQQPRRGGMGELGKTLRKVFEEMQQPVTASEPQFETASFDEDLPEASPQEMLSREDEGMTPAHSGEQPYQHDKRTTGTISEKGFRGSRKAVLRQGIILSEMLAPPIALRE